MIQVNKVVGNLLSSNMYIISEEGSHDIWLVDIGDFVNLSFCLTDEQKVKGLFLTHSHFDHIGGILEFKNHFPSCKVFTSEYGKEALASSKKNFSLYHESPMNYEGDDVCVVHDGDTVELFQGVNMNIIETPGHCPSCLTYYTDELIFTGDSYIPGVAVVTKLPKGNKADAEKSVERILELAKTRTILAGHDPDKWESWI